MVNMYDKALLGGGLATTGSLAVTGVNLVWIVLAGFAMIAVGAALLRLLPRR